VQEWSDILWPGLGVLWLGLGAWSAAHAVMYKRDSYSASVWALISFLLPIAGPWLYWVLGINRIERRAVRRRETRLRLGPTVDPARPEPSPPAPFEAGGPLGSLRTIADRVTRLPLLSGNKMEPLHNGEQAYPAMLETIDRAEQTLTLASYIFDWDEVGHRFADTCAAAARRGVRVHILLDGIGAVTTFSRMGRRLLREGVKVAAFFPLRIPFGRLRINLRNHRKILVADGRVGFTGGMNVSRRYLMQQDSPRRVEDLHFRVTGPVVAEMQECFAEDWQLATEERLMGEEYFPALSPTGDAHCRGIISGPDEDFEKIHWILLGACSAARRSLRFVTPYFVPSAALIGAMVMASLRGVAVSLYLPSKLDLPYMRWAADAYLWQLLSHGVRVYRRPPPFVHTKLLIVDESWLLLGSANLDRRSFRLNFEFNVEAYDAVLADSLARWLDSLIPGSETVTLEKMDDRPKVVRFRDGVARLFSPHL